MNDEDSIDYWDWTTSELFGEILMHTYPLAWSGFLEEPTMPRYEITDDLRKQLENSYTYHAPKGNQPERYVEIRDAAKEFALKICECAPNSRERSIALTDLEKVVTMVNKAIACNE